jgi:hypothetical protein
MVMGRAYCMAFYTGAVLFFILIIFFGFIGYFYILKSTLNSKDAEIIDPKPQDPPEE